MKYFLLIISGITVFLSCSNDLPYGYCINYSHIYCDGVYSCTDVSGDEYIKVGSMRYWCLENWILEDYYDCTEGYNQAWNYCEEKENIEEISINIEKETVDVEEETTPVTVCHSKDSSYTICYSKMSQDACEKCDLEYSTIDECYSEHFYKHCHDWESE